VELRSETGRQQSADRKADFFAELKKRMVFIADSDPVDAE
jgi:hypothetical protein